LCKLRKTSSATQAQELDVVNPTDLLT
jgi:hypothetical protein